MKSNECLQCGNPVDEHLFICPFCGSHDLNTSGETLRVKTVDIGHGRETTDQARVILERDFNASFKREDHFLVVIHGHGSSGKGGEIKTMVRNYAGAMVSMRRIKEFVQGEHLRQGSYVASEVARRHPRIKQLRDWNAANPGVTIFIF
jgi:hypothetical protein